jgi:hypothetical protein
MNILNGFLIGLVFASMFCKRFYLIQNDIQNDMQMTWNTVCIVLVFAWLIFNIVLEIKGEKP